MTVLKRTAALALIAALCVGMLPLFCAAEDSAGAVAAVGTAEASVPTGASDAETVSEPPAVEDVAEISAVHAEASAFAAIETAPVERVARAELQDGEAFDNTIAAYQPFDGEEGQPVTLGDALTQWKEGGNSGIVKLLSNVDAAALDLTAANFGGELSGDPFSSGNTDTVRVSILLGSGECGGRLTLDLNGYSLCGGALPLAANAELDDFDLTILNGTITGGTAALSLQGSAVRLRAEHVNFAADGACAVLDYRYDNSYSLFTDCTFASAGKGCFCLITQPVNAADSSLLYYLKDCSERSSDPEYRLFLPVRDDACPDDRLYTIIIDGDCSFTTGDADDARLVRPGSGTDEWTSILSDVTVSEPEGGVRTVTTDGSAGLLTDEENARAILTAGDLTFFFREAADAPAYAERFGRNASLDTMLTLTASATGTALIGSCARSAFTLDPGGQSFPAAGFLKIEDGGDGSQLSITIAAETPGTAKLFAGIPAIRYTDGDCFDIRYGAFFTDYSLNLGDSVSINLYTDGPNGNPDAVYYKQANTEYTIAVPAEEHDWIVRTLQAKDMCVQIDAYAVKKNGSTTVIDFRNGFSVKGYAQQNPAARYDAETQADLIGALNAALDTMLIYGRLAEKYFSEDYSPLNESDLKIIGVAEVPETDTTILYHADRVVEGMNDHTADESAESGYWASSVVLSENICLRFYFFGKEFHDAEAFVNGEPTAVVSEDGSQVYTVSAPISARQFDTPMTVTVIGADREALGSVTDSVEAYTARIVETSGAYPLAQAMRAYGAEAKRFFETKNA